MVRAGVGRLPVVDRSEPPRLLGMLGRESLATAYRVGADEEEARERSSVAARVRLICDRLWRRRLAL